MPISNQIIEDDGQRRFVLISSGNEQIIEKNFVFKSEANYDVKIFGPYCLDRK